MEERVIKALKFIADYRKTLGCCATCRELGRHLGMKSSSSAHSFIKKLEEKGYLFRIEGVARSLQLTVAGEKLIENEVQ